MEAAWFRFEEEAAERMDAASTATTLLRRSSRLSTEVRHHTEERSFSSLGSSSSPFFFRSGAGSGGGSGGRFEMQARVRRDAAPAASSGIGSGRFAALSRASDPTADLASRRTEFAQRFGMFTRVNAKEPTNLSSTDELDEVKKDLRIVREENLKLQAVITDVTEVNKRWQKYNNDRQMYVEKLLSTIQDQQEQMNKNIEKRLMMSKEGDENIDITRQLHTENAKLKDEAAQLKRRMENMEREHKEHVEVLEIQVKANKDDWEAEKREKELARQEKEKLEAKIQELQEEISLLKLKLSTRHLSVGQRRPASCGNAGGCQIVYGDDGRESHCTSHITICRNNSSPSFRTSVHVPCTYGHRIHRGSLVYLDDDLVIDGDSQKTKPALEPNVVDQELPRSSSADDSMLVSPQEKKSLSWSDVKGELNGCKDNVGNVEKCILDIPNTNGVTQSRSASTFSSASSLSLASGGGRLEGSLPNVKEMASSANSLVLLSANVNLPPLPTSYSDTVVLDRAQNRISNSTRNLRASASPLKVSINNKEAATVVDVTPQASTIVPNITAEPNFEEFPDGVLTQTREDVICPGCGRVFHPEIHLQFLQHFGECQSKNKANKNSALKTRN